MLQQVGSAAPGEQWQVCEVCRLVDDNRCPQLCRWCNACNAWICRADWKNIGRRAIAAMRRGMGM